MDLREQCDHPPLTYYAIGLPLAAVEFEWDDDKDRSNQLRHGLSFLEASELFASSDDYLAIFDEEHSEDEDRFIAIGPIARGVILVVHTEPAEDVIRIISARPATHREVELYRRYMDDYR